MGDEKRPHCPTNEEKMMMKRTIPTGCNLKPEAAAVSCTAGERRGTR